MSQLALTKLYGDLQLLFKSDIDTMWDELEAKTNGNLDSDVLASGWARWSQVTLAKDTTFTLGATDSAGVRFYDTAAEFTFFHNTTAREILFKIGGTTKATIDTSGNLSSTGDAYFYNRNTTYPLNHLIGYQKPVLVYVNGTTINVEQNTTTANRTLIVFPVGPITVTEDVSATHKFRQLKTSATANGYGSTHTGAADSGMRDGLSLNSNTWYFVYAAVVRYGDDAGNNFILVVDSTNPTTGNWETLDGRYGAGQWVYLGMFRYGHGGASTTTMIPFIQDHQGWLTFTGRASANNFFGIRVDSQTITTTSYTTIESFSSGNADDNVPANCSAMKITYRPVGDGDSSFHGHVAITNSSDEVLWYLPSFGSNLTDTEAHGWEFKIPNGLGIKLKGARGTNNSGEDWAVTTYISAVLDEWI